MALALSSASVSGKNGEFFSLFNLSLEELLAIKVTTASKFEETIHNAHASISIITKDQIAQFGGNYLNEILERVVSVNNIYGVMTTISTRAGAPWNSIIRHLTLINGRPSGTIAGAHSLYSTIPLSSIERIEYIRGPGSVLYGSNAYYGVINIITKKATREGWQAEQKLLLGTYGNQTLDGSYQFRQGNLQVSINMLYSEEDGWNAKMYDPDTLNTYTRKAFHNEQTVHLDIQYNNFSLSHFNSHQESFGNFWDAPEANYIPWFKDHPVKITNASYTYNIDESWRLENHLTMINKKVEWNSDGVADSWIQLHADLESRLLEINLFGKLSNDSTFLAGITREERNVFNSPTIPEGYEDYASIYVQYQQRISDSFSYLLGGQYVTSLKLKDNANNKSDFVPRAGLIYDINDKFSLKLLYGQAYRQPQLGERYIDSPGIEKGNPNLVSETIETFEAQVNYQYDDSFLTFTYYNSKEDDLILLAASGDPQFPLEYQNKGTLEFQGFELEYKYQPNQNWMFDFAWSWQENENSEGVENTTLIPNTSWKLGVGYNLDDWKFGLYNLYYGAFEDSIVIIPNRQVINPEADSFYWMTFKASKTLFKTGNRRTMEAAVELKNILDEEVYYPNDVPSFYPMNTLPGRAGRSIQFSLTYRM